MVVTGIKLIAGRALLIVIIYTYPVLQLLLQVHINWLVFSLQAVKKSQRKWSKQIKDRFTDGKSMYRHAKEAGSNL